MSTCPKQLGISFPFPEPTLRLDISEKMPIMIGNRTRQGSGRKLILKPAGHSFSGGLQ